MNRRKALLVLGCCLAMPMLPMSEVKAEGTNPFLKRPQPTCKDCKKCGPWCKCACKTKCRCRPGCCKPPKRQVRHQHPNHTPDPLKRHAPCPKCRNHKSRR